ncbi:MAG: phage virion morphogenesis protein [Burkholderiales bacterium]
MLEIDLETALIDIGAMLARARNAQPVLSMIGKIELLDAQQRIIGTKLSPDHEAWMPWAARTLKERTKKGNTGQGLLWDKGDLLHSLESVAEGSSVEIGTDMPYAIDLQDGTEIMPPREFLGWDASEFPAHEILMTEWLEGVLA